MPKRAIRFYLACLTLCLFTFGASELYAQTKTTAASTSAQEKAPDEDWDEQFIKNASKELRLELDEFLKKNGFTSKMRTKASGRFLFAYDVSDLYVEWISALLNEVAKAFDKFVDKTGLEVDKLLEPMTIVVFATREEFDAYALEVRGPGYAQLQNKPTGFYVQRLNRSIIYDRTGVEATLTDLQKFQSRDAATSRKKINEQARLIKNRENADSNTSTIVHEATHQLCYNYGVFSPHFHAPDWLVEGMAMTFEQTTPEATLGWRFRNVFPVNPGRLNTFRSYAQSNPNCEILDEILVSDDFASRIDDAGYAASWALFYYCYRKRPNELAKYMAIIANKKPHTRYRREERLEDFVECFGEIPQFGVDFAKFIRSL